MLIPQELQLSRRLGAILLLGSLYVYVDLHQWNCGIECL